MQDVWDWIVGKKTVTPEDYPRIRATYNDLIKIRAREKEAGDQFILSGGPALYNQMCNAIRVRKLIESDLAQYHKEDVEKALKHE